MNVRGHQSFDELDYRSGPGMYKYGIHLTPGVAEVSLRACSTSFLVDFFRAGCFAGIPALKTS